MPRLPPPPSKLASGLKPSVAGGKDGSPLHRKGLAERVGFEPTVPLRARLISSQVQSTTLPPLRCTIRRAGFGRQGRETLGPKVQNGSRKSAALSPDRTKTYSTLGIVSTGTASPPVGGQVLGKEEIIVHQPPTARRAIEKGGKENRSHHRQYDCQGGADDLEISQHGHWGQKADQSHPIVERHRTQEKTLVIRPLDHEAAGGTALVHLKQRASTKERSRPAIGTAIGEPANDNLGPGNSERGCHGGWNATGPGWVHQPGDVSERHDRAARSPRPGLKIPRIRNRPDNARTGEPECSRRSW